MSSTNVETVSTSGDRAKVVLAVLAVVAGIIGYYMLSRQPGPVRLGSIVVGLAVAVGLVWVSGPGRRFYAFALDAYNETRRVVWPTRKESLQVTVVVFGFVLAMAIFLWVVDKTLEWSIFDLILGWKR